MSLSACKQILKMQSSPAASSLPISQQQQQPALKEMAIAHQCVSLVTALNGTFAKGKRPHAELSSKFQSKSYHAYALLGAACVLRIQAKLLLRRLRHLQ
jgi:hypothetical protein